ncbi:MAG: flagellar biosynthetic protein FliO [Polyangiaceae bacterium]
MIRLLRVGTMAAIVMILTAGEVCAGPSPSPSRDWLRRPPKATPVNGTSARLPITSWVAVGGLGAVAGYVLWRRRRLSPRPTQASVTAMRIRQVTRLSAKAQLVAVEVQGRTLLLGATDVSITNLGWLDEDPGVAGFDGDSADGELPRESPRGAAVVSSRQGQPTRNLATRHTSAGDFEGESSKRESGQGTSRFRELLADAMGIAPKRGAKKQPSAPVDEVAAATQDRYVGSSAAGANQARDREPASPSNLVDVEGQAKGLVARLNRPKV